MIKLSLIAGAFALAAVSMGASFTESFDTGPTGWADTTVTSWGNSAGGDDVAFGSGTWHALNNSNPVGLSGWFSNPDPTIVGTHSGAGALDANFQNTTGTNTIDNWMMTPTLSLSNGDTFSFWTRTTTGTFPDRLNLKLSTSGSSTSVSAFTQNLLTVNQALSTTGYPIVWTQFSVTLSGLSAGASGRFAFNYNVPNGGPNGANSDFIGIDDVAYTANPVPEPASMAALGLGVAAMLRRRRKA